MSDTVDNCGWSTEPSIKKDESFTKDGWSPVASIDGAPADSGWGTQVTENNYRPDSEDEKMMIITIIACDRFGCALK